MLSSRAEGKETCSFLEIFNESKSKRSPPTPGESLESKKCFLMISLFPPGRTTKNKFLYLFSLPYPLYKGIKSLLVTCAPWCWVLYIELREKEKEPESDSKGCSTETQIYTTIQYDTRVIPDSERWCTLSTVWNSYGGRKKNICFMLTFLCGRIPPSLTLSFPYLQLLFQGEGEIKYLNGEFQKQTLISACSMGLFLLRLVRWLRVFCTASSVLPGSLRLWGNLWLSSLPVLGIGGAFNYRIKD